MAVNVNAADNVGVQRVELKVNGSVVATDTGAPYQFSWDSNGVSNGVANLVAVAYDAAGNAGASASLGLSVANAVAPAPATWTTCASEGGICSFTGTREVRYGGKGVYASKIITATTPFTNAVFGDPIKATAKTCAYSSITR